MAGFDQGQKPERPGPHPKLSQEAQGPLTESLTPLAESLTPLTESLTPQHVAIIMDGNGRWAKKRGLGRSMGHRAGAENLVKVTRIARDLGVSTLSVFAFSTENWKRPADEVNTLFRLASEMFRKYDGDLVRHGVKLTLAGDLAGLPKDLQRVWAESKAARLTSYEAELIICLNFGGQQNIAQAAQAGVLDLVGQFTKEVEEGIYGPKQGPWDRSDVEGLLASLRSRVADYDFYQLIASHLMPQGVPFPDLIIRTAGEFRLSNFWLWQAAYAEFYSTPVLWPDFSKETFEEALAAYRGRTRNFGALPQAFRKK